MTTETTNTADTTDTRTTFQQIAVKVRREADGGYSASCEPETVVVTHEDTVLNYALVEAPEGVVFWGAQIEPASQDQFKPPQVVADGRLLVLDDVDNAKSEQIFHLTLQFTGGNGGAFRFDPQIINRPG